MMPCSFSSSVKRISKGPSLVKRSLRTTRDERRLTNHAYQLKSL